MQIEYNAGCGFLNTTLEIAVEVSMFAPMQHVDETAVLSSLCGMTLAGLHAMQGKSANASIRHLILNVISMKEDESNESVTHIRKMGRKTAKKSH
jgi:hypothetical protein